MKYFLVSAYSKKHSAKILVAAKDFRGLHPAAHVALHMLEATLWTLTEIETSVIPVTIPVGGLIKHPEAITVCFGKL